jgi:hypothetical protein
MRRAVTVHQQATSGVQAGDTRAANTATIGISSSPLTLIVVSSALVPLVDRTPM